MPYPSDIGPALVRARRAAGLTQRELADRLGLKQPQVARWEAGAYRTASLERVDAVARALGMTAQHSHAAIAAETPATYAPREHSVGREPLARLGIDSRSLAAICRRHDIAELALFGSTLTGDFGPASDVDVLVRFTEGLRPGIGELLAAEEELGDLFGRSVDLSERSSVERSENYIRRRHVLSTARTVYVA